MTVTLTSDQVLALAPDPASAKAGSALATPRKWGNLGHDAGRAVWGECQGSGATPYQTRIDLSEPAFKCSCPSRKFPCKHGIALLLLYVGTPALFSAAEPPGWVSEWLASREQRAEKRTAPPRAATPEDAEREAAAKAKRVEARATKIDAGMEELALWIRDLTRTGLAALPSRAPAFADDMARRLIDAQAPGAARHVRQLGSIPLSGDGWPERLLARLSRLHLLVEAYRRIDTLPAPVQADVRTEIGLTPTEAQLDSQPGVADRWVVVGEMIDGDDRLRVRRTWLVGRTTGHAALLLHFAHGKAPFAEAMPPLGGEIVVELAYYPGQYLQRAVVRAPVDESRFPPVVGLPGAGPSLRDATSIYAVAVAANPWIERVCLLLHVTPERVGNEWIVRDAAGDMLAFTPRANMGWGALAVSGGHPVWLCGEWDGERLVVLSVVPYDEPAAVPA